MSIAVLHPPLVSAEEYLAGEAVSEVKHEYLDGMVYAMAGATARHSRLAGRITGLLDASLRGKRCRSYNSDLLLRIRTSEDLRFYYPDAMIHCGSLEDDARVLDDPSVVFEVLSESTARTDTGEKRLAYFTIPSLEAYILVASDRREVTVWRRHEDRWSPEVLTATDARLEFTSAACSLTVGEIYEGTGL